MRHSTLFCSLVLFLFCDSVRQRAFAESFGSGENSFNIEFVTIGNPKNDDDTTGYPNPVGKVDNIFRIGIGGPYAEGEQLPRPGSRERTLGRSDASAKQRSHDDLRPGLEVVQLLEQCGDGPKTGIKNLCLAGLYKRFGQVEQMNNP